MVVVMTAILISHIDQGLPDYGETVPECLVDYTFHHRFACWVQGQ